MKRFSVTKQTYADPIFGIFLMRFIYRGGLPMYNLYNLTLALGRFGTTLTYRRELKLR